MKGGEHRHVATATELTPRIGALADELAELLPDRSVIDGELVVLARGRCGEPGQDFNRLARTIFGRASAVRPWR